MQALLAFLIMAFTRTYNFHNLDVKEGFSWIDRPVRFSEIFSGIPQVSLGSTIQIEEVARIYTEITDDSLIDSDFRYFTPKYYLGNWQIINNIGIPLHGQGDDGFLNYLIQEIRFYSTFVIAHNPDIATATGKFYTISQCNFELNIISAPITPSGQVLQVAQPSKQHDLLRAYEIEQPTPIQDRDFPQKIGGLGMYFFPGCKGVRAEYNIAVINEIRNDYPEQPPIVCELATLTCAEYIATIINNTSTFASQADCQDALGSQGGGGLSCVPRVVQNPTDPLSQCTYYEIAGLT
jgi:hypothetical protein